VSQLSDDLRAARALIDTPEKWCKGLADGRNCVMWAVNYVTTGKASCTAGGYRQREAERALRRQVPRMPFDHGGMLDAHPVVRFNDDPATTHNDVLALFDRAILAEGKTDA
jgi:hypothetical protein